ncbi:MAG: outer membrane lipoprotein-sorting protein [Deltaproteobacteria bacterium]|nr:outer membrane lipoprotein-sorting protein [Deltaproteobacteria bacterium]
MSRLAYLACGARAVRYSGIATLVFFGGLLLLGGDVVAGPNSDPEAGKMEKRSLAEATKVLKQMDDAITRSKDLVMEFDMVVQDKDKAPRSYGMLVHTRGEDKRHTEFLYPGDVKGLKMLVLSRQQMYVYLPSFRKIRRIATHARAQSMFGSDYTYDEMSTTTYSGIYQATAMSESPTHYLVDVVRRPGQVAPYARLQFRIVKAYQVPDRIVYFDESGKRLKTETRSKFVCPKKDICSADIMRMVDHTKNDHWTEMRRKSLKIDTGFPETVFSLRRLQRGR